MLIHQGFNILSARINFLFRLHCLSAYVTLFSCLLNYMVIFTSFFCSVIYYTVFYLFSKYINNVLSSLQSSKLPLINFHFIHIVILMFFSSFGCDFFLISFLSLTLTVTTIGLWSLPRSATWVTELRNRSLMVIIIIIYSIYIALYNALL